MKWVRPTVVILLVLLPVIVHTVYKKLTALPREITITTGPEGGLYRAFSERLAGEIETRLDVKVRILPTGGSVENILTLRAGNADLALYQPGTLELLKSHDPTAVAQAEVDFFPERATAGNINLIANLYSQPVHFVVRRDAGINSPADLEGKRVAVGMRLSGDYAMSLALLGHFNLNDKIQPLSLSIPKVVEGFQSGTLDAAFITIGVHAASLRVLAKTGNCDFIEIPNGQALATSFLFMYQYEIPAGVYSYLPLVLPHTKTTTVAASAQLLTRDDMSTKFVEEVTRLVLDENFMRENQLRELFAEGLEFALKKPAFPVHRGAKNIYDPGLRPLVNPDFVEATEGMQSFFFSIVIAIFIGFRAFKRRTEKKKEHKLDRYLQSLLDIEERQVCLDAGENMEDVEELQRLLDEVTFLRQEALRAISAHELTEDRAGDCFIHMCHALSNKINAKISRQRLDRRMNEVIETMKRAGIAPKAR
jgi:TRAP transporter TAXI family solute receptor